MTEENINDYMARIDAEMRLMPAWQVTTWRLVQDGQFKKRHALSWYEKKSSRDAPTTEDGMTLCGAGFGAGDSIHYQEAKPWWDDYPWCISCVSQMMDRESSGAPYSL